MERRRGQGGRWRQGRSGPDSGSGRRGDAHYLDELRFAAGVIKAIIIGDDEGILVGNDEALFLRRVGIDEIIAVPEFFLRPVGICLCKKG